MPGSLALIHTVTGLVPTFEELVQRHLPDWRPFNIVDESLLRNAIRDGRLTEDNARRVAGHIWSAVDAGADAVLVTCSSIGPAVDATRAFCPVPLVRVDEEPGRLGPDDLPPEILAEGEAATDPTGESSPLYVPLRREGRLVGLVRLTDKLGGEEFYPVDRACAERLGASAALALTNALRFRTLERRSAAEPSGAHTFDYFQGVVRNEIEKASRFGRTFSLMTLDLGSLAGLRRSRGVPQLPGG